MPTAHILIAHMTYTALHHTQALDVAASVNRDPKRDGGLSVWLTRAQDERCFDCGRVAPLEFAHFVKAKSDGRAGGSAKSLIPIGAMACRECNMRHAAICDIIGSDSNLPIAYLLADGRADRIITEYPTRAELENLYLETLARVNAATREDAWETVTRLGL